ncbi:MFS transporter [Tepidibacter aestuarii]|uniref:MFS transporter n=1 Tax=Tepidibacter aestuarii TaxID=2925782 RepID=UPI0020C00313|nr:MFS transporter [Tepidibacter aestuarii]CAH2214113.1 putative MFS transporter, YQGE family, transporter [Tepidibacter aestuarii]
MSKEAKILLIISGLFTLAKGLSNVFVNIFLWKKSNDFIMISQYNLIQYIFLPIAFTIGGWLSKKKNGIWALRIGIVFYILFFILIILIKDNIIKYIYPLGILFGVAGGFYWLAFDVLSFDFTSTNNRDTFNGYHGFIAGIPAAIAPFAAAYIIDRSNNTKGYMIVFFLSLIFFVILILISLLLRSQHYGEKLDFKKIIGSNNSDWNNLRKSTIAWGLRDVVILFLLNILIYKTTGSEMELGKLFFISYLISSSSYILEQKFIKPKRRMFALHIGTILMFISVLGLVFKINYYSILFFIILDAISLPFFYVPMTSATFNVLDQHHENNMRIEYIINRDIALNTGRIISTTSLMIFLTFIKNDRALNYFLLFIGSAQLIALYFLRKLKIWDV